MLRFGAMATKRPENLMPGDRVLVWGDDLVVESAQPGVLIETADD